MHTPSATTWSPEIEGLKALSIIQPWAWLIVNSFKDIENRSWSTRYRGPLLIHAGKSKSAFTQEVEDVRKKYAIEVPASIERGGIVGIVDLADCVDGHASRWYVAGNVGWVLKNMRPLPFRACKGALGLFAPEYD